MGPSAETGPTFASQGGIFPELGYFYFQPNPRGSFGQGEAFTAANRKDFGYGDFRDVMKGVDAVEAKYPVDEKRLGLTGWSYGGFMTMFGVTQTTRFHAAVAGAGISDWLSYYGENSASTSGWCRSSEQRCTKTRRSTQRVPPSTTWIG